MDISIDLRHFHECGWIKISNAVPVDLCARLVDVLEHELNVPVHDNKRWDEFGADMQDFLPIWGHQAQWDIRQWPPLHQIWATLWNTKDLWVSLDSCRFTPPWKPGYSEPYGIHWDHNPWDDGTHFLQGVLALTDTAADQGGFRCVPSLLKARDRWPRTPGIDADGEENWLATPNDDEIVMVPALTGDLIIWNSRLPHGNSKNRARLPRLAFYVTMNPAGVDAYRQELIESWRTGRCVSWWRDRPGYDRTKPWPPANLSSLGRRLIGLENG